MRGGKRTGAGRKQGFSAIKAEEARKYVVERIVEELEPILTGQIEQAKGLYYEDKAGQKVYRKQPDARVATFLLNQLIGRPTENVDMNITQPFSLIALAERADRLNGKHLIRPRKPA